MKPQTKQPRLGRDSITDIVGAAVDTAQPIREISWKTELLKRTCSVMNNYNSYRCLALSYYDRVDVHSEIVDMADVCPTRTVDEQDNKACGMHVIASNVIE